MASPLSRMIAQRASERRARALRSLIHREAKIGGALFGPVPAGARREFFCLDSRTWVWHEEWTDAEGRHQAKTTRYDMRPNGILKSQGTHSYEALSAAELTHFKEATRLYLQRVKELYAPYQAV